jgi:tetratricopeptide (TPR) repeat protein
MSLLLEALKKAEKAKEEALRRAKGEAQPQEPHLRLEDAAAPERPVVTRAELPDIRQPLEILTDEIAPREPQLASTELAAPSDEAMRQADTQAADRATGRRVFEAKFREPNPRLPFYITLGALGVFTLGTVGYFWYQLRPPPPLVNSNPQRPAQELAVAAPEVRPTASPSAPLGAAAAAIPGLPSLPTTAAAPAPTPAPAPVPRPRPAREVTPVERETLPAPKLAAPKLAAPRAAAPAVAALPRLPEPAVSQTRQTPQVHPKVDTGYAAYLAGDLATARTEYQAALRDDAGNRDALLGLAAVDVRTGRYEAAEATYLRLLQADPNDAHAQAGLIALRASRLDPLATESRVKSLLAADPGANVLYFTLGNQLAQQGRWAEAQQEYFKAYAADPDNADFAFNLAVSLDHLRQSKLALDYYRRAIALAEKRAASFDLAAARNRAAQLGN